MKIAKLEVVAKQAENSFGYKKMSIKEKKVIFNNLLKTAGLIKVLFIVILLGIGWKIFVSINKNEEVTYKTSLVEKGTLTTSVSASGSVTSANVQEVTTQATGVVKKLYIEDGQSVVKGQKIAEIELDLVGQQRNSASYSSYLSAQKAVNSANNNYRSTQASLQVVYEDIDGHDNDETLEMKERRTKAEVANDNAYDATLSAKTQLTSAWLSYSQTSSVISAPISGVINLSVATGSQISSGTSSDATNQRIATITTQGTPIISVSVSEVDAQRVEKGQKAIISMDSIEDKTFTGKVVAVDRMGTSTSGVVTYEALIQMDDPEKSILPNMASSVSIITGIQTDVLLIPSGAISTSTEGSTVQVMKDGLVSSVNVVTGNSNDTQTVIVSGLSEGMEVVTSVVNSSDDENESSPFSGLGRTTSTTRSSGTRSSGQMIMGGPGF